MVDGIIKQVLTGGHHLVWDLTPSSLNSGMHIPILQYIWDIYGIEVLVCDYPLVISVTPIISNWMINDD